MYRECVVYWYSMHVRSLGTFIYRHEEAESMYIRSLELDPYHVNTVPLHVSSSSYGMYPPLESVCCLLVLNSNVHASLELDPHHVNTVRVSECVCECIDTMLSLSPSLALSLSHTRVDVLVWSTRSHAKEQVTHTWVSYEEEDTCVSYEEEDSCVSYGALVPTLKNK
jgi:hypothetical protein